MSIPRISEILESKNAFVRPLSWLGVTAVDNSADNIVVNGKSITFICVSGNIWINFATTAVANTTAIKLVAGQELDCNVAANLSIISDGSGGTYQYIIWNSL